MTTFCAVPARRRDHLELTNDQPSNADNMFTLALTRHKLAMRWLARRASLAPLRQSRANRDRSSQLNRRSFIVAQRLALTLATQPAGSGKLNLLLKTDART